MLENPEVIDMALDNSSEYAKSLIKNLKVSRHPITLGLKEAASVMMGKCDLSQRAYKCLKKILKENKIEIPTYDNLRQYCKGIDVGKINAIHSDNLNCSCMGYECNMADTLQRIVSTEVLYNELDFLDEEKQYHLSVFLKEKNPNLYKGFDAHHRTLLIRDTGDNFRGCSRYPTEQISYSLLNLKALSNCPYGQFLSSLWRGSESREML